MATQSLFPLDQRRELIAKSVEQDGSLIRKTFRLYSVEGDHVDIEMIEKLPSFVPRPVAEDKNYRVIAQEQDEEGYLYKIVMAEENGVPKEYFVKEKLPGSKRKVEAKKEESNKKTKIETAQEMTDKNIHAMLMSTLQKKRYQPSDEFLLLLSKTNVEEIPMGRQSMITVTRDEPLSSAFKKLIVNDILSAPVLKQGNEYYGFLDILDIVSWLVNSMGENILNREDLELDTIHLFHSTLVKDVMKYPVSKKNVFFPFEKGSSVLSATEKFCHGIHRVAAVDLENKILNVVTQSGVLNFINKHIKTLGEQRNMKVSEMTLSNQYVLSVTIHEKAIDAFRLIHTANVGGIAILDDAGKLAGNISARDIKRIASTGRFISRLFKPVGEFIENDPIYVKNDDTIEKVIQTICDHRLHRVYVVNDLLELEGVISLTDILADLLQK
jgi:CBS domain-containing protein